MFRRFIAENKTKKIIIDIDEYVDLKLAEECLRRLVAGGVHNWRLYDDSMFDEDEPDIDTFEENMRKEAEKKAIETYQV
jgi:hypothetical protein